MEGLRGETGVKPLDPLGVEVNVAIDSLLVGVGLVES